MFEFPSRRDMSHIYYVSKVSYHPTQDTLQAHHPPPPPTTPVIQAVGLCLQEPLGTLPIIEILRFITPERSISPALFPPWHPLLPKSRLLRLSP